MKYSIYPGLIVWVPAKDSDGNEDVRPGLVFKMLNHPMGGICLLVLMISTSPPVPQFDFHIQVHNTNAADQYTGLYAPCWAKCNWVRVVQISDLAGRCGDMPDDLFDQIAAAYDRIATRTNFDHWI